MASTVLTEKDIQRRLSSFFTDSAVAYDINNLYIFDWESDKLIKTKSGYFYEFEIKVTKADFKNDFKKEDKHAILSSSVIGERYLPRFYKYFEKRQKREPNITVEEYAKDRLRWGCKDLTSDYKLPNYFYYAVPDGLVEETEIPPYAGLVYVHNDYGMQIVKKAPKLHSEKYKDWELNLTNKFYYNMRTWMLRANNESRRCQDLYKKLDELQENKQVNKHDADEAKNDKESDSEYERSQEMDERKSE